MHGQLSERVLVSTSLDYELFNFNFKAQWKKLQNKPYEPTSTLRHHLNSRPPLATLNEHLMSPFQTSLPVKILPRLLRSGSTGNVGLGLWSECSYSHFRRTHTSGVFIRLAWARCSRSIHHAQRGLFATILPRLAWARYSRGIRYVWCGLFAALLTRLAWARCSRGIHHTRHGLFAALLTRLTWARCSRGIRHTRCGLFAALLIRLAWARCSRGIRHARRDFFPAFLTRLAWARCSGEGWSQHWSRG